MKLSVVIPTLDEARVIEACIESARAPGVEIVVADGGSQDPTRERARAAGAATLASPPGRARQLAAGVEACGGDVVLFLHADTRLPSGYTNAVRDALEDPAVVGGAFALRFDLRSPAMRLIEAGARLRVAWFGLPYGDQALFMRRSVLDRIGGVPQTPFMEDLDLVRALRRQGRLARLGLAAVTSGRRYAQRGPLRAMWRNWLALAGWRLGLDRERLLAWYRA